MNTNEARATPDQGSAELPPLPEAKVMVRDTGDEPENGGWIVDCDCEGPLSYSLEANEALYTADQMREYGRAILAAATRTAPSAEPTWWDGQPSNIQAAAADAIVWLNLLARNAAIMRMPAADRSNLIDCRDALSKFAAATQGAPRVDLHAAIGTLPCKVPPLANGQEVWAYQYGHRDARHAAAELVAAQGIPQVRHGLRPMRVC